MQFQVRNDANKWKKEDNGQGKFVSSKGDEGEGKRQHYSTSGALPFGFSFWNKGPNHFYPDPLLMVVA